MNVTNPYADAHRKDAETVQVLLDIRAMASALGYDGLPIVRRIDAAIEHIEFMRVPNKKD